MAYLVNCTLESNREHEAALFSAASPFEVMTSDEWYANGGGNGNVCSHFFVSTKTNKGKFGDRPKDFSKWDAFEEKWASFYAAIPSALLMYRLACLFEGKMNIEGKEGYKFVWTLPLKHKETGEYLSFGEWKGGSLFWTKFHNYKEMPEAFKRDTLALLNALLSKKCPHPYDGLVAGGVA